MTKRQTSEGATRRPSAVKKDRGLTLNRSIRQLKMNGYIREPHEMAQHRKTLPSVSKLADQFRVSTKTIYRDHAVLKALDLPVTVEREWRRRG